MSKNDWRVNKCQSFRCWSLWKALILIRWAEGCIVGSSDDLSRSSYERWFLSIGSQTQFKIDSSTDIIRYDVDIVFFVKMKLINKVEKYNKLHIWSITFILYFNLVNSRMQTICHVYNMSATCATTDENDQIEI
jgi:hypothetical protein